MHIGCSPQSDLFALLACAVNATSFDASDRLAGSLYTHRFLTHIHTPQMQNRHLRTHTFHSPADPDLSL
jgi:hypothetical protein